MDWEKFGIRKHMVKMKQIRTVVLGWSFGLILGVLARCGVVQQVSLCPWILGFIGLVLGIMKHFYNQIPKIQSWDNVPA